MKAWFGFALGALVAVAVATTAFVAARNREHAARELARARVAVAAVARGETPVADVLAAAIVSPAKSEGILARWQVGGRVLGGPAETDKWLADGAAAAKRDGAFVRFAADGSGRIVAVQPVARGSAVLIAWPMGRPAAYPWLVVLGLLALGAGVSWLGRRLEHGAIGLFLAVSLLAVPAAAWGGAIAGAAIVLFAAFLAALERRGRLARVADTLVRHRVAYAYLAPAALGMGVLVLAPFAVGIVLGFFDHSRGEWHFAGLANFAEILSGGGRGFDDPLNFWFTLVVTLAWTSANVALHVTLGLILALALREKWMRARGLFRVLLVLPWAIPNYITALIWKGMFQSQFGAVNAILEGVGLSGVAWFSHFGTSFAANVVTNTWLGFPFMMVVTLGALESIPRDLYEAAAVDGAGAWDRFVHITLPQLRPALLPAVILGSIWTFNMFNVIYLVSSGRPAGTTDILVTQAYRWAFERGERYGMAAAYATIIFVILAAWTLVAGRLTRAKGAA